jgi:hypothetical protein
MRSPGPVQAKVGKFEEPVAALRRRPIMGWVKGKPFMRGQDDYAATRPHDPQHLVEVAEAIRPTLGGGCGFTNVLEYTERPSDVEVPGLERQIHG